MPLNLCKKTKTYTCQLQAFQDYNLNVVHTVEFVFNRMKNIIGNGEITGSPYYYSFAYHVLKRLIPQSLKD